MACAWHRPVAADVNGSGFFEKRQRGVQPSAGITGVIFAGGFAEFFAVEGFIEVVRRVGNQQVKKAARQKSEHVESVAANGFVDARFRRHGRVGGDARAYKGCVFVCGNIDCLVFGRIY